MKKRIATPEVLSVLILLSLSAAFAQQAPDLVSFEVIATIDYPSASSTIPAAINDQGYIVGLYVDANNVTRGFLRFPDGKFSAPIVDPNDTGGFTLPRGINHARVISGYYTGSDGFSHGYFLSHGNFGEFDVLGADDTLVEGLNDSGDFVGGFDSHTQGLTAFSNIDGITTAIIIPGATSSLALDINSSREITGQYTDGAGEYHGWWQDSGGGLHFPFDPPNSTATLPFGISDKGYIVGRYSYSGTHAFLVKRSTNSYVTFDYPGSSFTGFSGLNDAGLICGRYADTTGLLRGFLARVVSGR